MNHRSLPFSTRFATSIGLLAVVALSSLAFAAEKLPDATEIPVKPQSVRDPSLIAKETASFQKLVADLAAPEMEGRGLGTKGLDLARDYLIAEFKKLDLQPAFNEGEKARSSFTQKFEINAGVKLKSQSLVMLDKDGQDLTFRVGEQFNPRGFSASGQFEGQAVFVGYGIDSDELKYSNFEGAGKDSLKGKIAVAYRFEPMDSDGKSKWKKEARFGGWSTASSLIEKAKWAKNHGAAAIIVVDPPSQKEGGIPSVGSTSSGRNTEIPIIQISRDAFYSMLRGGGLGGDASVAKKWQEQANAGNTKPIALGDISIKGEVRLVKEMATVYNVAAFLPGDGKLKDQVLVVGGHYDHLGYGGMGSLGDRNESKIHHGADDNASGTAGVVMLARQFVQHLNAPSGPPAGSDRRSILFVCFTAEERGLLGSAHMLRHPKDMGIELKQIVAMLNMDMIGRMKENNLMAIGTGTGDKFRDLLTDAAKGTDLKVNPDARASGGSDQMSFHAKKIPAIHFFTGAHRDYHKPTDTANKINAEGAVKATHVIGSMLASMWWSAEPIEFNKVRITHPASGGPRGGGAYLGIVPNYASIDSDKGCAIDGTSAGSPAEAAGLKADDVIVGWNGKKVANLQELSDALKAHKPGDEIKLNIVRDKKPVELKLKLGSR